ncbi:hypothetical protein [Streptomyces hesseae]|uniref:Uncharacterized protein n=1 Tax=Streptomyces hesseae TaxID=3075519 RepID=A0ABU2SKJ8_9ACTN|nr:hypothetical protein [Streptomyces sp. DSM 40473]MDT0449422.1 hypothetical protein [Streptomyces sp. DSM 40473]
MSVGMSVGMLVGMPGIDGMVGIFSGSGMTGSVVNPTSAATRAATAPIAPAAVIIRA